MSLLGLILIPPIFAQIGANNFDGAIGYRFKCVRDMVIEAVGRFPGSLNSQNHDVRIWTDAAVELSLVTITPTSPVDVDGYRYALTGSVSLVAGQFYRIASTEFNGGDNWLAGVQSSASMVPPNTSASDFDPSEFDGAFGAGPSFFPGTLSAPNASFGKHQLYESIPDVIVGKRFRGGGKVRRPGRRR